MKITAIISRYNPSTEIIGAAPEREIDFVDEFMGRLEDETGASTSIIEGSFPKAPADSFILAFNSYGLSLSPLLCRRTILINADYLTSFETLERLRLLGAVERYRYFLWKSAREKEGGHGLLGRIDIAKQMGVQFQTRSSSNYQYIASKRWNDLPSLLGAYLMTCEGASSRKEIASIDNKRHSCVALK